MQINFSENDRIVTIELINMLSELNKIDLYESEFETVESIRRIILDNISMLLNEQNELIKTSIKKDDNETAKKPSPFMEPF